MFVKNTIDRGYTYNNMVTLISIPKSYLEQRYQPFGNGLELIHVPLWDDIELDIKLTINHLYLSLTFRLKKLVVQINGESRDGASVSEKLALHIFS